MRYTATVQPDLSPITALLSIIDLANILVLDAAARADTSVGWLGKMAAVRRWRERAPWLPCPGRRRRGRLVACHLDHQCERNAEGHEAYEERNEREANRETWATFDDWLEHNPQFANLDVKPAAAVAVHTVEVRPSDIGCGRS